MKKADVGSVIFFKRESLNVEGTVVKTNDNSVIVEISESDMLKMKLPNNKTVVNHKNYLLL